MVEEIRVTDFRLLSDRVPLSLLERRLRADAVPPGYGHIGALEDIADLFRLEGGEYLMLKVFAYVYAVRGDLWLRSSGSSATEALCRFRQFRRAVEQVAKARRAGVKVERCDLMDFEVGLIHKWTGNKLLPVHRLLHLAAHQILVRNLSK